MTDHDLYSLAVGFILLAIMSLIAVIVVAVRTDPLVRALRNEAERVHRFHEQMRRISHTER